MFGGLFVVRVGVGRGFAIECPLLLVGVLDEPSPEDLQPAPAAVALVVDEMVTGAPAVLGDALPVSPVLPQQPAL